MHSHRASRQKAKICEQTNKLHVMDNYKSPFANLISYSQ